MNESRLRAACAALCLLCSPAAAVSVIEPRAWSAPVAQTFFAYGRLGMASLGSPSLGRLASLSPSLSEAFDHQQSIARLAQALGSRYDLDAFEALPLAERVAALEAAAGLAETAAERDAASFLSVKFDDPSKWDAFSAEGLSLLSSDGPYLSDETRKKVAGALKEAGQARFDRAKAIERFGRKLAETIEADAFGAAHAHVKTSEGWFVAEEGKFYATLEGALTSRVKEISGRQPWYWHQPFLEAMRKTLEREDVSRALSLESGPDALPRLERLLGSAQAEQEVRLGMIDARLASARAAVAAFEKGGSVPSPRHVESLTQSMNERLDVDKAGPAFARTLAEAYQGVPEKGQPGWERLTAIRRRVILADNSRAAYSQGLLLAEIPVFIMALGQVHGHFGLVLIFAGLMICTGIAAGVSIRRRDRLSDDRTQNAEARLAGQQDHVEDEPEVIY